MGTGHGPNFSARPTGLAITNGKARVYQGDDSLNVSNSELQTWKSCHRKWYFAYYRGLGLNNDLAEVTGPRSLGTRIHAALEHYYTKDTSAILFMKAMYDDQAKELISYGREYEVEGLWKEYDLAHAMLTGYVEWIEEEAIDEGLTLVAAEGVVSVNVTGMENVKLRSKMDQRVVRNTDNARLFRDFKTTGSLTAATKTLHMNEQMKTYHLLEYMDSLEKTGGEPQWRTDGALYTMLRKVKRTATAKPPFYSQLEVRHNIATVRNMWIRVIKEIEEIFDARVALDDGADHNYVAYPRPSGECTWCDYFPICSMFDDGSNAEGMVDSYYRVGDPDARYNVEEEGTTE